MDEAPSQSTGPNPRRSSLLSVIRPQDVRTQELEDLLLWRLRAASVVFLGGSLLGGVLGLLRPVEVGTGRPERFLAVSGLIGLLAGWLFTRRTASLRGLRRAEVLLFGLAAVGVACLTLQRLTTLPSLPFTDLAQPGRALVWTLESCALYWWFLIVLYGAWVPNTWRRCAAVVAGLATLPLGLVISLGIREPALGRMLFGEGICVLLFWIGAGAAVAVYGSHRINLLAEDLAAARTLGPYRVLRRLGEGGMGVVYLAEHRLLQRPCAVKVIRPERAGDATTLRRFEREVQVLARLTHWNIVEIFDYGHAEDGTFYFAMEYLPGLTWQDLVDQDGPLPVPRVLHLLRQACAALRDVHAAGLVHRDLKPVNLLVCERGRVCDVVKLLDFGIVQPAPDRLAPDQLTTEGKFLGTPLYVSPEQIRAKEALDARSDLYSLGAVAYFLLTGEPPFIRDSVPEIFAAHLRDAPVPPAQLNPSIPSDLEAVILRCLEKQPAQRYPDAATLGEHLSRCAGSSNWTDRQAEEWWRQRHPELLESKPQSS